MLDLLGLTMRALPLLPCFPTPMLTLIRADQTHVTTLSSKIRELNSKVADIQREQRYMREVEANFRDASESTNARAVWWSLLQIAVLIGAAVWQMRHLKVSLDFGHRCMPLHANSKCHVNAVVSGIL